MNNINSIETCLFWLKSGVNQAHMINGSRDMKLCHFALSWAQKWDFYRVTDTQLYSGNEQYPKKHTIIAICSRSNAILDYCINMKKRT